jgi:hypothetical protein
VTQNDLWVAAYDTAAQLTLVTTTIFAAYGGSGGRADINADKCALTRLVPAAKAGMQIAYSPN